MKPFNLQSIRFYCISWSLIIFLMNFTSCSGDNKEATPTRDTFSKISSENITPSTPVNRIISMSPNITETLIHLGLQDQLVAVDTHSMSINGIPSHLNHYDIMTPDIEDILTLNPDIILTSSINQGSTDNPFQILDDLGLWLINIPAATSLEAIKRDILFLGQVTNTLDQSQKIIDEMSQKINEILTVTTQATTVQTVYFEIDTTPSLYSFGSDTFLNEMITLLGGSNIFSDQQSWITVSEEHVLLNDPDIIFTNMNYVPDPVQEIIQRPGWNQLSAVQKKKVYSIDTDTSSRPNEYVVIAMEKMAKYLYPELFGEG